MAFPTLGIGDKQIVADELNFSSQLARQDLPAVPVIFSETVFDRDNGISFHPAGIEFYHFLGCLFRSIGLFEDVLAFLVVELTGCCVQSQRDLVARLVSRRFNGLQDELDRFLVGFQVRRKTTFIADGSSMPAVMQDLFKVMKDLGAHAHCFRQTWGANRHDHEFLEIDVVVRVGATVDYVHHWDRKNTGLHATDVAIE